MQPAIEVTHLRKAYGATVAVDDVTFEVRRGELLALIGPNGAGKTTTLEAIEGLRRPDGGSLRVMGVDPARQPARLRDVMGVALQVGSLPDTLQVEEALRLLAAYHGCPPDLGLLDRLGLAEKRRSLCRALSVGQQRRLILALAMLHRPPVLILDEPTAGLDVPSRFELHRILKELRAEGTTILLSSHDMAEVEELADRVAILLRGRLAAVGSPRELTASGRGLSRVSVRSERQSLARPEVTFTGVQRRVLDGEYAIYFTSDVGGTVAAILSYLGAREDSLIDLRVERPSLEERFLEIAGQPSAGPASPALGPRPDTGPGARGGEGT